VPTSRVPPPPVLLPRAVLPAAPALLLAGVVLMAAPDAWTVAHLVFLGGALLMLPVGAVLHGLLDGAGWLRPAGTALTTVGALALAGQFVLDFAVRQLAGDADAARSAMFDRLQESPVFALIFYSAGPALLFTGLALSGLAMVRTRPALRRPGWVLVAGTLVMAAARIVEQRIVEIVGLGLILAALALVAHRWTAVPRRAERSRAAV
jgi:hypothetical protein